MKWAGIFLIPLIALVAGCSGADKPKSAEDCYNDHLRRVEAIRTFGSEENRQRQMDEAVQKWQACGEQALQNSMKK